MQAAHRAWLQVGQEFRPQNKLEDARREGGNREKELFFFVIAGIFFRLYFVSCVTRRSRLSHGI